MKLTKRFILILIAFPFIIAGFWIISYLVSWNIKTNFINNLPKYSTATEIARSNYSPDNILSSAERHNFSFKYTGLNDREKITKFYDQYLLSSGWKKQEDGDPIFGTYLNKENRASGELQGVSDTLFYEKSLFGIPTMKLSLVNECSIPNKFNPNLTSCSFFIYFKDGAHIPIPLKSSSYN